MKIINFILYEDLSPEMSNYYPNKRNMDITLLNSFTIKSDTFETSYLYSFTTHDTIKNTKINILRMLEHFNYRNKIAWSVNNKDIRLHNIIISKPDEELIVEVKKQKKENEITSKN